MGVREIGARLRKRASYRWTARRATRLVLGAIGSLAACSGSGGLDATTAPGPNATIAVTPASASVALGSTVTLHAEVKDASGKVIANPTVFWSSSDTAVATVTSAGIVTARAVGTAQVAASTGGVSAVAAITVTQAPVASVTVTPGSGTVTVGARISLHAVMTDGSGATLSGRPVVWATSAPQVATVDANGVVTGVSAGTATISATSEGKSGTASITVTVIAVASLSVSPSSASLTVGQTVSLNATALDASGNVLAGRQISWASSNGSVAKVSAQGLVTALAGGNATITATSEGKSASAQVVVAAPTPAPSPPPVASVVVSPSSGTLTVGGTLTLSATTRDASGAVLAGRSVIWSTSAPAVASVSSSGVVTALAPGSATITATSEGKSGSASITVQAPPPPAPTVGTVTVSPSSGTLAVSGTLGLTATVRDGSGTVMTGQTVTWASSAPSVASVSSSGVVTGVAPGGATITATAGGKTGSASITVQAPDAPAPPAPAAPTVARITISPAAATMRTHQTRQFTATPTDSSGNVVTGVTVTWTVSDSSLVSLSSTGPTTAAATSNSKRGTVTITAAVGSVTGNAFLTVQ